MTPNNFLYGDNQNSTSNPLASGDTYTGIARDCSDGGYTSVIVALYSDVSGILYMEQSVDGTNWDSSLLFNVAAETNEIHRLTVTRSFYRTRYVNNGTDQSEFRMQTSFGPFTQLSAPKNLPIQLDADSLFVRPTLAQDEIRIGRRLGVSSFNKFGYREGLTAAAGEETIWATTGNFTPMTVAGTFNVSYNSATDGAGTTGALTLLFVYIDSDGLPATATHTLGNDGTDTTSFSGLGINRCAVSSTGSSDTNNNTITVTATTGGTTQAIIPALGSVTQQAIYFVGSHHDVVAKYLWANVNKTSGGGIPRVMIKGYVYNRAIHTRFEVFRATIDSGTDNFFFIADPIGFNLSATDVLYFVADTDVNNTIVNIRFSINEYQRT